MKNKEKEKDLKTILKEDEKQKEVIKEVTKLLKGWKSFPLEEQIKRRRSLLYDLAILPDSERKLCIQHLAKSGIVKEKEALETVREYALALGIDPAKEENPPQIIYTSNLTLITPAQDFIDDKAYVTIPVNILVGNFLESVNYIITSERQKIRLSNEELLKMDIYSQRKPYLTIRWSEESSKSFLEGKEKVSIAEVFNDIYQLCKNYIDFGNDIWNKYIALWITGTYFHRLFETYPYIHLNGDMESGKTKTLMFTSWLAFNGEYTFNSSPSYVVRAVHNNHSTCCIDEVERLRYSEDPDSQLLIAMYNSGYKKGSFCGKSEQNLSGEWVPKQFEAYSPKMFASIKSLDPTLASRCIPIMMFKTGNKEIKNRELNSNDFKFQEIRDHLYHVMLSYFEQIRIYYQTLKDEEILGREWELWKPILAIAKVIDVDNDSKFNLYNEIRNHALEIQKLKKEARIEETIIPKVLAILKDFLSENICPHPDNFWPTTELLRILKDSGEEEFAWLNDEKKQNKGRWLGDILRRAGIVNGRAEQKKIELKNVKGYRLHLEKIEERLKNYET